MWAVIPDYPNYEASTDGDVRKVGQVGVKKLTVNDSGYLVTGLKPHGSPPYTPFDIMRVHRLVLKAFLPNPAPWHYDCVDHIDGNPLNNRLVNLRWSNARLNAWNRERARGWDLHGHRYRAYLCERGRFRHLGMFDTPEEARARYLEERHRLQILYDPTNRGSYIDTAYRQINSLLRGGCTVL